jgi:hypothetical protein
VHASALKLSAPHRSREATAAATARCASRVWKKRRQIPEGAKIRKGRHRAAQVLFRPDTIERMSKFVRYRHRCYSPCSIDLASFEPAQSVVLAARACSRKQYFYGVFSKNGDW